MDTRTFQEELERQNKEFESAMKQLEELGNVGFSIPEETLRAIDAASDTRSTSTQRITFGIRG